MLMAILKKRTLLAAAAGLALAMYLILHAAAKQGASTGRSTGPEALTTGNANPKGLPVELLLKEQMGKLLTIEQRLDGIERVGTGKGLQFSTAQPVAAAAAVPSPPVPAAAASAAAAAAAAVPPPPVPAAAAAALLPVTANAHVFYYPWYGTPAVDGKWLHWNHVRIAHWNKQTAAKYVCEHDFSIHPLRFLSTRGH